MLGAIFLLVSLTNLCASFVAGLYYGAWDVAVATGLWALVTGLYAVDYSRDTLEDDN